MENEAYILPRLFNVNDFNQIIDGEIVGLPANDVSMNSKKPYQELKSMKTKAPTRVSVEEAMYIKDLYKWLQAQGKFKETTLPFHQVFGFGTTTDKESNVASGAYYLSLDKNGGIQYFENVPISQMKTGA